MLSPGDIVGGKYRIVRLIGDGGMGSVYEARHERLGTAVALKFLHADIADRPGLSERFLQEAKVAAAIVSPHVAHVTDMDAGPDGQPYLVLELVVGESLEDLLEREHKLPLERAIDFSTQIAAGLEAAHAIGVVHRDLKPSNVLVTQGTTGPLLKVIDFGIAKLRETPGARGLTRAGVLLGTPEYMPPEQLFSASEVDARADVYALGVMLFEMLSGRRPAEAEGAQAIVGKVLAGDVLSLAALEPALPAPLVNVVERATAGDRDRRFASIREFSAALAPFSHGGPPPQTIAPEPPAFGKGSTQDAPPLGPGLSPGAVRVSIPVAPPTHRPTGRPRRARSVAVLALVLLLVALAAGAVALLVVGNAPTEPPPLPTANLPPETPFVAEVPEVTPAPPAPPGVTPTTPHTTPGRPPATAAATGATAPDGGTFPIPPLTFPSTLPPLPSVLALPSTFPTTLPTAFPTTFPGLPMPGQAPAQPPKVPTDGG